MAVTPAAPATKTPGSNRSRTGSALGVIVVPVGPDAWVEVTEPQGDCVGAVVIDVMEDGTALVLMLYDDER